MKNNIYEVYFKELLYFLTYYASFLIQKQAVRNSRSILSKGLLLSPFKYNKTALETFKDDYLFEISLWPRKENGNILSKCLGKQSGKEDYTFKIYVFSKFHHSKTISSQA